MNKTTLGIISIIILLTLFLTGGKHDVTENSSLDISHIDFPPPVLEREEKEVIEGRVQFDSSTDSELVHYYSARYGVEPYLVACILEKESNFNPQAIGDNGKAVGMAQFHLGTFKMFRKKMGLSQEDLRTDKAESIKVLCWALSRGYGSHWTPYKKGVCR